MPEGKGLEVKGYEALPTTVERGLGRARKIDQVARQGACGMGVQGPIKDLVNFRLVVMVEGEAVEAPLQQPGFVAKSAIARPVDLDLLKSGRALGARRENRNGYEKPQRSVGPHGKERMAYFLGTGLFLQTQAPLG